MEEYQYDPKDYDFIPATVWDNPLYANSPEYIKNLQQMSPALRAQRLEGRWDCPEGAFFSNFNPARHIFDTLNNPFQIPRWWPRWVGIDWGFAHHSAISWHTRGEMEIEGQRRPIILTYREAQTKEKTAEELAEMIADRSEGETIRSIYLSPDAFARRESIRTIANQMTEALLKRGFPACAMADNDRIGGWNLMYQLLELDDWMVFDTCPNTISAIPMLIRDPEKLEDAKKTDSRADDIMDSARYGLKSYLQPRTKPPEIAFQEKLEVIQDHTAKVFFAYRHMMEKQNDGPVRQLNIPRWAIK